MDLTADFDYTGDSTHGSLSTDTESSILAHQDDLIGFLGLMNHFDVPLLPLTWQPALATLGRGSTAKVNQALVHAGMSYAFKRMRTEKNFERWVNEVMVLTRLRGHPNISSVEACCLEILDNGKLSPVLVFQMAELGDLEKYMRSDLAEHMEFQDSLRLCLDVGAGLKAIHEASVVHCDLKPSNILVYRDANGKARAKIADFGHAVIGYCEDTLVYLPTSIFWNAPDHHPRGFRFHEAKKFDAYSYGLIVYWLLIREKMTSEEMEIFKKMTKNTFKYDAPIQYNFELEADDKPGVIIVPPGFDFTWLAITGALKLHGLSDADIVPALRFFNLTLADEHQNRSLDWDLLLSLLNELGKLHHIAPFQTSANDTARRAVPMSDPLKAVLNGIVHPKFNLRDHIHSLTASDPYIRNELVLGLQRSSETWKCEPCRKHNVLQVALFAFIGFGHPNNSFNFEVELDKSGFSLKDLEEEVAHIRMADREPNPYNPYKQPITSLSLDYFPRVDLTQDYRNIVSADFESLKGVHLAEIASCRKALGSNHSVTIGLTRTLAGLLKSRSRFAEATVILNQALLSVQDEIVSLPIRSDLIVLYRTQGHTKIAEREANIIYTALERALGFEDSFTLNAAHMLASTWLELNNVEEAEKLSQRLVTIKSAKFGRKHPTTMTASSLLAAVYLKQGRFTEAEHLQKEILEIRERMLGPENEFTWTTRLNLAAIYTKLNRLEEAAAIERLVVSFREDYYGPKHDLTLTALSNLAMTYREQKKFDLEEKLLKIVVTGRLEVLGSDHPNTLTSVQALATNYLSQKLPEKAEPLFRKMVEARSSRLDFGPTHPSTLASRNSLAWACFEQSKIQEAKTMQLKTIKDGTEKLGESHWAVLLCKRHLGSMLQASGDLQGAGNFHSVVDST